MEGDQVGIEGGPPPRPWDRPFVASRLREMFYSLLSWPYIVAFALTDLFFVTPNAITLQAMMYSWVLAFARREFASIMAARQNPVVKP